VPLTKDQALGICDAERRRTEAAIEKTSFSSHLRAEYPSPADAGAMLLFVFLLPVLIYYCCTTVVLGIRKATRWIQRGFQPTE
jgi:hypothetical protein